jgi:hypothetical protein
VSPSQLLPDLRNRFSDTFLTFPKPVPAVRFPTAGPDSFYPPAPSSCKQYSQLLPHLHCVPEAAGLCRVKHDCCHIQLRQIQARLLSSGCTAGLQAAYHTARHSTRQHRRQHSTHRRSGCPGRATWRVLLLPTLLAGKLRHTAQVDSSQHGLCCLLSCAVSAHTSCSTSVLWDPSTRNAVLPAAVSSPCSCSL